MQMLTLPAKKYLLFEFFLFLGRCNFEGIDLCIRTWNYLIRRPKNSVDYKSHRIGIRKIALVPKGSGKGSASPFVHPCPCHYIRHLRLKMMRTKLVCSYRSFFVPWVPSPQ